MEQQQSKNENKQNEIDRSINKGMSSLKKGFVWRPVPTILSTTLCFLISGLIFLFIGCLLLYFTTQINEFSIRYDIINDCNNALSQPDNNTCYIDLHIESIFNPPVMVYYQLENFYQVHRRYIQSYSINQLAGKILTTDDIKTDCDPIVTVQDLGIYTTIGGYTLNATAPANPCGLIARSLFNDTYKLYNNNQEIFINETGIAWDSDRNGRYKAPANASLIQWTDVENEHFMVWMRPAGLPDFRKLWGRINTTLNPGTYRLQVSNNFNVAPFSGTKSFVLSTANMLGGKNNFLGVAYIVVGCVCIVMALLFWVGYKNYNNDKKIN